MRIKPYHQKRRCEVCGNLYIALSPNAKYCSDECKVGGASKVRRKYIAEKEKLVSVKKPKISIGDILKFASENNLTYGQAVQEMGV